MNGSREGQEGGRERRDAGSDAAGGGDSESGVGVGEGGGEQRGAVGGDVGGESARGGVGGVESVRLQQSRREVVEGGRPVVGVQGVMVVVVGHGGGHGGGFPLRGAGAQVGDESNAQGVGRVKTLHRRQVPRDFCQALPETNAHEIHGQGMGVKITCKGKAKDALSVEPASRPALGDAANPALARPPDPPVTGEDLQRENFVFRAAYDLCDHPCNLIGCSCFLQTIRKRKELSP